MAEGVRLARRVSGIFCIPSGGRSPGRPSPPCSTPKSPASHPQTLRGHSRSRLQLRFNKAQTRIFLRDFADQGGGSYAILLEFFE